MSGYKLDGVQTIQSVCPYCAVGCGLEVAVKDGRIVNIEGDPRSPINEGTLCPKGAASIQLAQNAERWTTVKYRAARSLTWVDAPLSWAMEQVAGRMKYTREMSFEEDSPAHPGMKVMRTRGIAALGGAVFDNEENYALVKLLRSLGVFRIENQARV